MINLVNEQVIQCRLYTQTKPVDNGDPNTGGHSEHNAEEHHPVEKSNNVPHTICKKHNNLARKRFLRFLYIHLYLMFINDDH